MSEYHPRYIYLPDVLRGYDIIYCAKFAVWCAEKVLVVWEKKYPEDNRPRLAIEAAKNLIANPTKEKAVLSRAAGHAVVVRVPHNAYAAANAAANAAYAAHSAYVIDGETVYFATGAAVHAATLLNDGRKVKDLLNEYNGYSMNQVSLFEMNKDL